MAGPGHYLAAALVTLAFLAAGVLAGRKTPARAAPWFLDPCVLLAVFRAVLMLRPDWETRIFPWPAYAFYQRQWVYPMGVFILAYGGARLPVRWNRAVVWSLAGALAAWSLAAGSWMLRAPCPGRKAVPPRGEMTVQSTGFTCAPAACATLLAAWGIERSEHQMAQLCLCVRGKGTSIFDKYRGLVLAAEGSGMKVRVVSVHRDDLGRVVKPFVIGAYGHALVIFEVRGDKLLVGDPFDGRPGERPARRVLEDDYVFAFLLCREHPFDGGDAPHIGEWIKRARRPWRPQARPPQQ